ncbi:MAG: hypothetical protein ACFB15_25755 [Cyclobacteriaceae bacterium]
MIALRSTKRYSSKVGSCEVVALQERYPLEPSEIASHVGLSFDCNTHQDILQSLLISAIESLEKKEGIGYIKAERLITYEQLGTKPFIPITPVDSITSLTVWDGTASILLNPVQYSSFDNRLYVEAGHENCQAELRIVAGYDPEALPELRRSQLLTEITRRFHA